MAFRRWFLAVAAIVLAGCSGSGAVAPESAAPEQVAPDASEIEPVEVPVEDDPDGSAVDPNVEPSDGTGDGSESSVAPPPLEAPDENITFTEPDSSDAWISRRSMEATSIEVVWSAPEGAVEYQVHRLGRTDLARPQATELTESNRLHTGEETGTFLDDTVVAGELYWYGIRGVDAEGEVLSVGWHEAAAVTDVEPPEQVELSAVQSDGAVLLEWTEPAENFQLHGYRILRAVGNGEPEVVATTWTLDQRSFLDDGAPEGAVSYSVVAFDFHWNDSDPTEVTIDRS